MGSTMSLKAMLNLYGITDIENSLVTVKNISMVQRNVIGSSTHRVVDIYINTNYGSRFRVKSVYVPLSFKANSSAGLKIKQVAADCYNKPGVPFLPNRYGPIETAVDELAPLEKKCP